MPRTTSRKDVARQLAGQSDQVDVCAELYVGDVRRGDDGREEWENLELLICVGGRWDRNAKAWLTRWDPTAKTWIGDRVDRPRTRLMFNAHRGQEPAARWFAEWLRRYLLPRSERLDAYAPGLPDTSCLMRGGRRSGKTHMADVALVMFCVANAMAETDALSPVQKTSHELVNTLKKMLNASMYTIDKDKDGPQTFVLANGSRIRIQSGGSYRKSGRCDLGFMNEAQQQPRTTLIEVAGATMDYHGLVLLAANPASEAAQAWVDDYFRQCSSGEVDGVAFDMNPQDNPLIAPEAIASMRKQYTRREAERELDGREVAFDDAVMHEWSEANIGAPPAGWADATESVIERRLGVRAPVAVGMDFQGSPWMSARAVKVYRGADGQLHPWVLGEWDVEGDETELSAALVADGIDPATVPAVIDASAWWQDGPHHDGRQSDRILRRAGWRHLFRPDGSSRRNPSVKVRLTNANRLLCDGDGHRALRVSPDCRLTIEAMKRYPRTKWGEPSRRSRHAHGIDALTYALFRLFPPVQGSDGRLARPQRAGSERERGLAGVIAQSEREDSDRRGGGTRRLTSARRSFGW